MRKFVLAREAGLPPEFATVMAWVPAGLMVTELLVIEMSFVDSGTLATALVRGIRAADEN
jgi:hypothetical protein